ncbi:MAG: UDP-N-acetylmuramoyl-L-alanyl-D-glutamate--2,6-diaminopimelate ligase [Gammaproteobacteria bacterium]|nr:UDP-N-acetylmuramoyl-L-alanyl-D-glutamate--2,6-diaminopimelate ligase [Gammaproteobacteria bacterium]
MAAKILPSGYPLCALLDGIVELPPRFERTVTGLTSDSREVEAGDLFLARQGASGAMDAYIDQALSRGAAGVVYESGVVQVKVRHGAPLIPVQALSLKMGLIADRFYQHPSADMWLAGVTGTNGKTSVSHYIAQSLQGYVPKGGKSSPCALLGTLGYGVYGELEPGQHTTPDVVTVHRLLSRLVDRGARRGVMEVSSHGLVQGRIVGLSFDVAVFTNLSRDHLDYHGDMDTYARVKRGLFHHPGLHRAVINVDDPIGEEILSSLKGEVHTLAYSLRPDHPLAQVRAMSIEAGAEGLLLDVQTPQGRGRLVSPLLGRFNGANLLATLATLLTLDLSLDDILERLAVVQPVAGRMERFGGSGKQPLVVVDYAHTPDALAQVLQALRVHCRGELYCVFGCGGQRDRGKRAEMGAVAEQFADHLLLTDDNPRREEPKAIISDIRSGLRLPDGVEEERDRAEAIARVLHRAGRGDIVVVAGKGHEDYQEIHGVRRPYSDRETVRVLLGGVSK